MRLSGFRSDSRNSQDSRYRNYYGYIGYYGYKNHTSCLNKKIRASGLRQPLALICVYTCDREDDLTRDA